MHRAGSRQGQIERDKWRGLPAGNEEPCSLTFPSYTALWPRAGVFHVLVSRWTAPSGHCNAAMAPPRKHLLHKQHPCPYPSPHLPRISPEFSSWLGWLESSLAQPYLSTSLLRPLSPVK